MRAVGNGVVLIGSGVEIGAGTTVLAMAGGTVTIGDDVFISGGCIVAAVDSVRIGAGSMLAEMVCIRDHDHDPDLPPRTGGLLSNPVLIGDRVWLGSKFSVVRGGSVGDDSVIGAHALVNRPVPANTVAVGVPARVVRQKASGTES